VGGMPALAKLLHSAGEVIEEVRGVVTARLLIETYFPATKRDAGNAE